MLFTWSFWNDAITRAIRTFAQTLLAVLGGGALNIWQVGWHSAFGVAAGSAFLALLMAVDRSGAAAAATTTTVIEPVIVEPLGLAPAKGVGCGESLR